MDESIKIVITDKTFMENQECFDAMEKASQDSLKIEGGIGDDSELKRMGEIVAKVGTTFHNLNKSLADFNTTFNKCCDTLKNSTNVTTQDVRDSLARLKCSLNSPNH